jgi:serpin B
MLAKFFTTACAALAATAITTSSLSAAPKAADMPPQKPVTKINVKATAKDNNAFALELFQELRSQEGNIFFSPYSVSSALGMTYGGAKNKTATGMEKALHLSLFGNSFHSSLAALSKQLEKDATENKYQLSVANQLWGDKFFKKFFLQSFLDLNKKIYGANMETLDFKNDPKGAATSINDWVSKKTNEKIPELVSKEMFQKDDPTALVLTNAIYFKGDWATKFEKENTKTDTFFLSAKDSTKTDLMFQQSNFLYAEDTDAKILAIPYQGGSLQMVIVLPTKKDGLPELEKSLSLAKLDGWVSSMFTEDVKVKLPKFKTRSSFSLNKPLISMGMKDAFEPDLADFSGMADLEKLSIAMGGESALYISDVVHKAFVEVNEEGSEAAAATAVIVGVNTTTSVHQQVPPKEFIANHPFLYMIRDTSSGAILFMGRMQNPKA